MCCRKGILLWQPIAKQKAGICLSENQKCTSNKKSGFFAAWLLVSFQSCACVRFEKTTCMVPTVRAKHACIACSAKALDA